MLQGLLCLSRKPGFGELHALRAGLLGLAYEELSVSSGDLALGFFVSPAKALSALAPPRLGRYDPAPFLRRGLCSSES